MSFWEWLMGTPPADGVVRPRARSASERATPLHLRVGDVVCYDGIDYMVINQITYRHGGFTWYDFYLVDETTDARVWLSVEDDDGLELGLYRDGAWVSPDVPPVPRQLTCEGQEFRLTEHGEAEVTVERDDPRRSTHTHVEYWEFSGPDGRQLSINRWGDEYDVSLGQSVHAYELSILPARV